MSYRNISWPWKKLNIAMKALKLNIETYELGGDMDRWFVELEPRLKEFQHEYTKACKRWKREREQLNLKIAEAKKRKNPDVKELSKKAKKWKGQGVKQN